MNTFRTLVVEDNEINLKVALGLLGNLGHDSDTARGGEEALALFEPGKYDAIFMDCHMPGLDGFETTRAIRALEAAAGAGCRPVHIVAVTADARNGSRERCLAAGMNDFLTKPISSAEFREALGRTPPPPTPLQNGPGEAVKPEEPVLDTGLLEELREIEAPGRPHPLAAILDVFLAETPPILHRFNAAVEGGDQSAVQHYGRQLKAACSNFGARRALNLCAEVQESERQNRADAARAPLTLLNQEFNRIVECLGRLRETVAVAG